MKKIILYCISFCFIPLQGKECIPASFNQAKHYFDQLSTQQIKDVDLAVLTDNQFDAFKSLSKQLFHKEIASHSCSSPANRTKAEIMMQKVGTYY